MSIFLQRRFSYSDITKKSHLHKNPEDKVQLMTKNFLLLLSGPNIVIGYHIQICDCFVWTEKDIFLETICVDTEIQADILTLII